MEGKVSRTVPPATLRTAVPSLELEDLQDCARLCAVVAARYVGQKFPYGFGLQGSKFGTSGELILGSGANGLTCASFVLALLHAVVPEGIVDDSTWLVRTSDDIEWAKNFGADARVLQRLMTDIFNRAKRVRPAEMLAANEIGNYPVTFADCEARAREIEASV